MEGNGGNNRIPKIKATGGLCAEKKNFSGWQRRLGVKEKKELGLGFFVVSPLLPKLPPLECELKTSIYRQNVARFFNLVPQLPSFYKF